MVIGVLWPFVCHKLYPRDVYTSPANTKHMHYVGPTSSTLYKWYTNALCLLGHLHGSPDHLLVISFILGYVHTIHLRVTCVLWPVVCHKLCFSGVHKSFTQQLQVYYAPLRVISCILGVCTCRFSWWHYTQIVFVQTRCTSQYPPIVSSTRSSHSSQTWWLG